MFRPAVGLAALFFALPLFAADDVIVEFDGMKSKAPAGWKQQKAGGMRRYQFKIEKGPGEPEDTEIVVFHFGKGGGGSVDDNIKRWKGMYDKSAGEKAKVETFKVGNVQVTMLDISGTFMSKPPGDPNAKAVEKPDFRALHVVFASPEGPYYINLRGPAKRVEAQKKPFEDWLKAFK